MNVRRAIRLLAAVNLLFAATAARAGAVLTVINTSDTASGSLRQAIFEAGDGDSIVFDIPTSDPGCDRSLYDQPDKRRSVDNEEPAD